MMDTRHGNGEHEVKVTMIEIAAGEGYNQGPELRVLVQSDEIVTVPMLVAGLPPAQREIFDRYQPKQSDFRPFLGKFGGFRFTEERTFPMYAEEI